MEPSALPAISAPKGWSSLPSLAASCSETLAWAIPAANKTDTSPAAMGRFEQYERKIDDLESQVDAYDLGKKTLADEFADLESDDEIDDELAALKKKVQSKNTKAKK